jgi:hypothetical protein
MYNVNAKTVEENANLSNVLGQQLDLITRTTGIRIAREIKRIYEKEKLENNDGQSILIVFRFIDDNCFMMFIYRTA